jgi:hypothetical protein
MSAAQPPRARSPRAGSPRAGSPRAGVLARAALGLYPAAWRARYGDEVRALVEDSGAGLRTIASLAWRAIPAWVWPARHLWDRPARMRASLATVLVAWTALIGLALVFVQLTQAQPSLQGLTPLRHPIIGWSYWVFDGAVAVSVLAVAVGGLPLWLAMMRGARNDHRRRDVACLLSPVAVPAVYLCAVTAVRLLRHAAALPASPKLNSVIDLANGGVGRWWFLALIVGGFAAAGVFAAGPGLALHRLHPAGPQVGLAAGAAGIAAAAMCVAGAASAVAAAGLYSWAPRSAGYHQGWPLGIYLLMVLLATTIAIVSAARGIRAARSPATA